jgi:ATP-dependent DNA helicase RecQ
MADHGRDACLYAIQVALSGAARTHGRIGKTLMAQMLTGSNSKKIKGLSLHRLSTFGLLKPLRQSDAGQLLDWLIDMGYLKQIETTKFRPITKISTRGQRLMSGAGEFDCVVQLPKTLANQLIRACQGKKPHIKSDEDSDEPDKGPEQGDVEDLDITPNSISQPDVSKEAKSELESVNHGANDLVDDVSPELDGDLNEVPATDEPSYRVDSADAVKPSYYWTWKLVGDGYGIEEVQQIRQIDVETLQQHLLQAAENRFESAPHWLLSDAQISRLTQYVGENEGLAKAALISRLPAELTTQQLLYFLNCGNR